MKKMHEGQVRKVTNAPYYVHPLTVLGLMEEAPFFFAVRDKQAALLHDIQEDSPLFSWDEIVFKFGHYVAGAVALLSKTKLGTGSPAIYFSMLQHANPNIIAIKLLDRLANTSDYNIIRDVVWLEKYLDETIQLVLPLVQIMVARGSMISPQGYYELGTWIDDRLQSNLHGMQTRTRELRREEYTGVAVSDSPPA
jgi:(p)ppGpp synthase/HD superfamily hydrolase